jgi:Arc/MetJ family transcription regulator
MRTTLDLDEKLLEEVVRATGEKTRSKAVNKALDDYVRGIKIDQLRAMAGKIDIVDNWRELEELELKLQERLQW